MRGECEHPIFIRESKIFPGKCIAKCNVCGRYFIAATHNIKYKCYKSCGCIRKATNVEGQTFDRLYVLHEYHKTCNNGDYRLFCLCRCSCGTYKEIYKSRVTGNSPHHSCGCITRETNSRVQFKHGGGGTRFYDIYSHMCRRCYNPKDPRYKDYGGRGITICDRWKNNFLNFKNDMYDSYQEHVKEYGEKDTTLDRIDVDGNYELSNCRWATWKEQARNTRSTTIVEYHGLIIAFPYICDCFELDHENVRIYLVRHRGEDLFETLFDRYLDMKGIE